MSWRPRALPPQHDRTVVITGGNAGIGYFAAEQLARAGARVVLASRSAERAATAIGSIRRRVGPEAALEHVPLDLTSLASVRAATEALASRGPIDALVNNAALVIAPRRRQTTSDGLELLVGGNFLGHFALTAQLWPALAPEARVVGLGSLATKIVRPDLDDLLSTRRYRAFRAYAFSKHAVHGFAFELDRRLRATDSTRLSLLAHPGYAVSELAERVPGINDDAQLTHRIAGYLSAPFGQGKDAGAWPVVRAVADPEAIGGAFYGPSRLLELSGPPVLVAPVASSAAPAFGRRLWESAEELTGVAFPI